MTTRPDTFCIMPFIHLHNMSNGLFRMCCLTEIGLVDDFGQSFVVGNQPISKVWNSNCLTTARKLMLENKEVSICSNCYKVEDSGGKSLRQEYNEQYLEKNIKTVEYAKNNQGLVEDFPNFIELRTGSSCNSACRMCNSNDSSLVYMENIQIQQKLKSDTMLNDQYAQTIIPEPNIVIFGRNDERLNTINPNIDAHIDEIVKNIANIETLTLSGGEPFLLEKTTSLLEIIATENPNIKLHINTNGSIAGERIQAALAKLNNVHLCISLDGYGTVNEYIRYPLKWEKIERNIQKFNNLRRDGFYLSVNITVQTFNIFNLDEIIWFLVKTYPHLHIKLSPLVNPLYFNIQMLPRYIKDDISYKYRNFAKELEALEPIDNIIELIQSLKSIYQYMRQITIDTQDNFYFDCLKSNIKVYDRYRKQNIQDFIPDLSKYL